MIEYIRLSLCYVYGVTDLILGMDIFIYHGGAK